MKLDYKFQQQQLPQSILSIVEVYNNQIFHCTHRSQNNLIYYHRPRLNENLHNNII